MNLIKIFRKIKREAWVLKYIIPTIYFNFHYLPFKQAVKLPILLYKPHFLNLKGKIIISGGGKDWYDYTWEILCVIISQHRYNDRESWRNYRIRRKLFNRQ